MVYLLFFFVMHFSDMDAFFSATAFNLFSISSPDPPRIADQKKWTKEPGTISMGLPSSSRSRFHSLVEAC